MQINSDISGNEFRGTIPNSISDLVNIYSLRLNDNNFGGTLPFAMSQLKMLQHLSLFGNNFEGTLPFWLSKLQRLRMLDLGKNKLTGSIPIHLSILKHLQGLLLNDNLISGKLEDDLSLISKLKYLSIDNNKMEGSIPNNWSDRNKIFPDLEMIKLSDNQWSCPIPNYSKWAKVTDYEKILASLNGKCSCLLSLWSEWSECHDSFGPGSVKIQTRNRRILVKAENNGHCGSLKEYRPCRQIKPISNLNDSITNIDVCISADPDNFGVDIDLTTFGTNIEIENFILEHKNGKLSCQRNHPWSFTNFGCNLCQPWQRMFLSSI